MEARGNWKGKQRKAVKDSGLKKNKVLKRREKEKKVNMWSV